ncbi:hypothetical protein SAMN02745181_3104 [Rubritalea squalenifaciens DSM 18772]|uniref:Uncharacterized protein n=2 Tax=Rubritalea TaxID=361050 RepID=A0A1M6P827_9BACT|nr:hypothetical protein [Rubritalea squalenifaciens]SHK04131.1 hypothetical protein SAMN02745181_3104 [Rubritalea squalenifaciens DSM 18772]
MSTTQQTKACTCIDRLIAKVPAQADALLDIRLAMTGHGEPGQCVAAYFKLTKTLSGWHRQDLEELRSLLENRIQIEIVVEESNHRSRSCLSLGNNHDLSLYCEEKMKMAALQNKQSNRIFMGFCWAERV